MRRDTPKGNQFQSTLGHEGPSDLSVEHLANGAPVSIHARPRGAERHVTPARPSNLYWFQSTLGHEGPSDRDGQAGAEPRRVSIHARPRGAERLSVLLAVPEPGVSIHARPRGAERQYLVSTLSGLNLFQSTLGHEGPSDTNDSYLPTKEHVSIHARPRGAERLRIVADAFEASRFNPRSATRGRATHPVITQ